MSSGLHSGQLQLGSSSWAAGGAASSRSHLRVQREDRHGLVSEMLHALPIFVVAFSGSPGVQIQLNNGVNMPVLAFGANVWAAPTCKDATSAALSAGFRFIWSSQLIGAAQMFEAAGPR